MMRKLGLGKRLLTMLLVLALCFSMVPGAGFNVTNAATGDLVTGTNAGQTGLKDGVDASNTISWPIKIYDYLQDGMLFDYSSAHDFYSPAEDNGGAYGGGANVPMISDDNIIGLDYTISTTYDMNDSGYAFNTWGNKSYFANNFDTDGCTEVTRSVVAAQDDQSPMYLHLDYTGTGNTRSYGWVANFARDDETYYTGDEVRYMVIVYRTNQAYATNTNGRTFYTYWAVSDGAYSGDLAHHSNDIDISNLTDKFGWNNTGTLFSQSQYLAPSTDTWGYQVIDMKTNRSDDPSKYPGIASNWNATWTNNNGTAGSNDLSEDARVAGVGMCYPLGNQGEAMDISHIAFFSDPEEAARFGTNAVKFDNDPGEYIGRSVTMSQSLSGGTTSYTSTGTAPTISNNGWNFTAPSSTAATNGWNDPVFQSWSSSPWNLTTSQGTGTGYYYAKITDTSDIGVMDYAPSWDYSGGIPKADLRYITVVYRLHGISSNNAYLNFFINNPKVTGKNPSSSYRAKLSTESETTWSSVTFDLDTIASWDTSDYNSVSTVYQLCIQFPGFGASKQIMDIAYIDYFSSTTGKTSAENWGSNAAAYLNGFRATTTGGNSVTTTTSFDSKEAVWTMGSNQAFTMLYASSGGGWFDLDDNEIPESDSPGGDNPWTNGYFSYAIGDKYTYPTDNMSTYRNAASAHGYIVSDSIFLLDAYPTNKKYYGGTHGTEADARSLLASASAVNLNGVTYDVAYGQDADGETYVYAGNKRFDMSQLDMGYTLYNTLTEGVMTAGLLQSSQAKVTGIDGKSYTIMQYKTDTVSYIARLLQQTLVIPERDYYGYNYTFVKGTPNGEQYGYADDAKTQPYDLASALRAKLGITFTERNYTATTRSDAQASPKAVLGSPEDTASRLYDDDGRNKLIGPFLSCKDNIETFYDAAYYLLHNLFVDNSYNQRQTNYNYLVLSKGTLSSTDREAYVFDAGFTTSEGGSSGITYDPIITTDGTTTGSGTITMSSGEAKDEIYYGTAGYTTTRFPFLPVTNAAGVYGEDMDRYFQEDGATNVADYADTYATRNYNYVMQANGEFVYHYEDSLFFQFEGDDDVYLFVNGELVLDIGAAHAITSVSMDMNDYVKAAQGILGTLTGYSAAMSDEEFDALMTALSITENSKHTIASGDYAGDYTASELKRWHRLNLVDGESYSIDFYYMERHGWGANMRVATNIVMTDPALGCDKTAYQNGTEISYGGIVEKTAPIEYSFALTNNGNSKLYNLTFDDHDIGVTLDPENGLTVATGFHVSDASGSTLDAADLVAYVDGFYEDGSAYETIKVTFADNDALKAFLEDLTGPGLQSGEGSDSDQSGGGLWKGSTVTIRGIYYTMSREQQDANQFDNTVYVSATTAQEGGSTIKSEAGHRVRSVADAIHFYQWAGHPIGIHRNYVYSLLTSTVKDKFSNKSSYFVMYTCQSDGTDYSWADVTGNGMGTLFTASYAAPGRYLIYIKLYVDKYTGGDTGTVKSNRVPDVLEDTDTTNDNDYDLIPVIFYVTDVEDSTIVLDYGLKAELTGEGGIYANDVVQPHSGAMQKIMGITSTTPSYMEYSWKTDNTGTFQWEDDNRIDFTPADGVIDSGTVTAEDGTETTTSFDGKFSEEEGKLYFTPTDFMDSTYTIYAAVSVYEEASGIPHNVGPSNYSLGTKTYDLDISKEVQMYQKVTVLPANVVYYEDDFDGISYDADKVSGSFITHTGSSDSWSQGVDQTIPYGQDPAYQASTNTAMSGNSLHTYEIQKDGDNSFASFTFTGTGFEIIGQTNAIDSGTMVVKVTDDSKNEGEEDKIVYHAPVITEFDNNADSDDDTDTEAIYQVPVVRVDGLTYGSYTVTLEGSPEYEVEDKSQWVSARSHYDREGYSPITQAALDELLNHVRCIQFGGVTAAELNKLWVEGKYITEEEYNEIQNQVTGSGPYEESASRKQILLDWLGEFMPPVSDTQKKLYIDGVRIFQPYGDTVEGQVVPGTSAYYSATESGADFEEVRELIMDGKVAFVNYKGNLTASTADMTWVENRNGTYQYNYAASVEDYLIAGPNNEVYLRRTGTSEKYGSAYNYQALVLYVSEVAGATGSLQVGIRAMDHKLFLGKGTSSAIKMDLKYRAAQLVEVQTLDSSTEQYYTIDYTNCPTKTVNGKTVYEVVVFAQNTSSTGMVAFTSLKHNGLTIESIVQPDEDTQYETGTTWAYIDGVLTETVTGNTSSCVHMNLQELSEVMRMISLEEQNVPEEAPEVVPAPERVKPVTDIVADDGDKGFSTGTMVIIGVCVVTALVAAYLLTKKYLRYL